MIVWLNGTFGAGKTSTARELLKLIPDSSCFDPVRVARMLGEVLPRERLDEVGDCRDLSSWRRLVVETGVALLAEAPGTLVVPMELFRQEHRDEIFGGFASRRIEVRHFLLHAGETILPDGTDGTDGAAAGACGRRVTGEKDIREEWAGPPAWLAADAHPVDTTSRTPRETAERIVRAVHDGAGSCGIVQTAEPRAETVAAGVLLFDDRDRVLLVDPTYKPGWEFPGGVVEPGEAPSRAGMREVAEETGLELTEPPRLLVVDWEPPASRSFGGMRLLFDGGRLPTDETAARLTLPKDELRDWRFVTESEAALLLSPTRQRRLHWALRARERATVLNLEAGVPVGG
ncbi:NUDIX hydrolase [Streptomyces meridianus]|uniref:NUDIX hydrolase n=1 Tax=Streptomyces meridianus TaxID=2938945 RepID=UPI0027E30634|nr:NUDIX domain-containing protein [Streptomyces meridianus]